MSSKMSKYQKQFYLDKKKKKQSSLKMLQTFKCTKMSYTYTGKQVHFQRLVRTNKHITPKVKRLTGITSEQLVSEDTFDIVFSDFIDFVKQNLMNGHVPVLVSHNSKFDQAVTLVETRRHDFDTNSLYELNAHFADTLPCFKKVRKLSPQFAPSSLKQESLFAYLFPGENYCAHDALQDVLALKAICSHHYIQPHISETLVASSFSVMKSKLERQIYLYVERQEVSKFLGGICSRYVLSKIVSSSVTLEQMKDAAKSSAADMSDFLSFLVSKKIVMSKKALNTTGKKLYMYCLQHNDK